MTVRLADRAAAFVFSATMLLAACSGAFGDRVHESVHQTVAAGSAPLLRVDNVAGAVRIEAGAKPSIDVDATKYGYDAQDLRRVTIAVNREAGRVSIVTKYAGDVHGGGVNYRIFVPRAASLQIQNVAGSVKISGVDGNIDVQTQAGSILANAGRVADTRSIDLRATTGTVTLTIGSGSSARVEASSTVGSFATDIPAISQQRENIVGVRGGGTIGGGSALIHLSTTTGSISLRQR